MPAEMLTYAELAARLNCSPEAARALVKRHRLPRSRSNGGNKVLVSVDLTEIAHKPLPARAPGGDRAAALKARVETLEQQLAALETVATGHRADFERERDRCDLLVAELVKAQGELLAAQGELMARRERDQVVTRRPWWRRLAG